MNYCERCGGRMNSGDWYDHCEFCGEDDEWTMNQPLDKEKVKCENCGTELFRNQPVKNKTAKTSYDSSIKKETVKTYSNDDFDSEEGYRSIEKKVNPTFWLVLGIVSLIVCCMPTSIGTIVYSAKAKKAEEFGHMNKAEKYVGKAIKWFFAGVIINVLLLVASFILQLAA